MLTTGLVLFLEKPIQEVLAASGKALFDVKVFYEQIEGDISLGWYGILLYTGVAAALQLS